jgi:ribonuclease D
VQIAAGLVGFGHPLSLGNLVGQTLGVAVPGGETRTDWRRRPLSPGQIRYALDDVRHLLDIADLLRARLEASGRTPWAEAEFADFLQQIESRGDEDRWRRLPGVHQLNRRGLEVARRLSEWRQEDARRANRPLRQVLRDDLLVAIAKRQPAARRDLEALRDFNRPALLGRAAEILAVIAEAQRVPVEQLPEPAERREEGPGQSMVVSLLAASLTQCCAQQQVAPGLVGTTGDLKDLIRWHTEGPARVPPPRPGPGLARGRLRPDPARRPVRPPRPARRRSPGRRPRRPRSHRASRRCAGRRGRRMRPGGGTCPSPVAEGVRPRDAIRSPITPSPSVHPSSDLRPLPSATCPPPPDCRANP